MHRALARKPEALKVRHMAVLGASHVYNNSLGVGRGDFFPHQAALKLGLTALNVGYSGASSSRAWSKRGEVFAAGFPDIVCISGDIASNDFSASTGVVAASPAPTSTVFTVTGMGAYHYAGGKITVGGESAVVLSMSADQITLTAPLAGGAPSAGTAVLVDTVENVKQLIDYYRGRGVRYIFVLGVIMLNFSSPGDTLVAQEAWAATARTNLHTAATAKSVTYIDLLAWGRARINAGEFALGDFAWHVADTNTHPNAIGGRVFGAGIASGVRTVLRAAGVAI